MFGSEGTERNVDEHWKSVRVHHNQPHLVHCYSRSIALMLYGVNKSKIYFEVQLGVNKVVLSRVK